MKKITRKDLSQIYFLNEELKMWQKKMEELRSRAYPQAIKTDEDATGPSGPSDKVGNLASEIADTSRVVEGILTQIQIQIRKIYRHIETVEDSQLRQIIQYRCVDLMRWKEVGDNVGITADAARMIFNRAYPPEK